MAKPDDVANDNRPALARHVPIVGCISGDGVVTITDPTWRPTFSGAGDDAAAGFPNENREA